MHKVGLFLSTVLFGAFAAGSAQATLSARDLNAVGDGLLTFDSATNLEWLDPSKSLNRSLNDLTGVDGTNDFADPGSPFFGFRYATAAEMFVLFDNGGVRPGSEGTTTGIVDVQVSDPSNSAFLSFRDLFFDGGVGVAMFDSTTANGSITSTNGYAEIAFVAEIPEGTNAKGGLLPFESARNRSIVNVPLNLTFTDGTTSEPTLGSFLLRNAASVPEPSSMLLFFFGLGGIAAMRWRKGL